MILRVPFAVLSVALGGLAVAFGQTVTPPPASPLPPKEDIVELSPFTVNTSSDVGYVAENTLAGSRLNSKLRDTASSVSVITKGFSTISRSPISANCSSIP